MLGWSEYFLGCETHTYAMAKEMISKGYEVHIFTYLKKEMWNKMKETGAKLLDDDIKDEYDVVIINNNGCMPLAPKSAYKIFVSNGVIPANEYPVEGADRYISVSEEVKNNLNTLGYDSILIRNGVDCERFKSTRPINKKLKNVLILSNKQSPYDKEFQAVDEACRRMKLHLIACGLKFGTPMWETEEFINMADLVISLGRGTYEGMACGRNVIVGDYQGLDGFLDEKTYLESRKHNCSGRRFIYEFTLDNIIGEFKKYNINQGEKNRKLALENHDIKNIVKSYLNI